MTNTRLHILDYETELTREFLMSWLVNNSERFGQLERDEAGL
ncbi:hypothetical protein [Endozoicomonas numazuensis]|nr:hypothetical protein [Endozoicomonas numazuensis]